MPVTVSDANRIKAERLISLRFVMKKPLLIIDRKPRIKMAQMLIDFFNQTYRFLK